MSKAKNQRIIKQEHGKPNPIMVSEERTLLALVDKALESSSNPQSIGRNGEIPIRDFFNRYLPYTLRAATGHFVPPSGKLSPQIDIMILDSRYPLLAENADGSVLAMLHSVIQTIEIKTRITPKDIEKSWIDASTIMKLASEVDEYGSDSWCSVHTSALAYRSSYLLDTLEDKYIEFGKPEKAGLDIYIMRLAEKDQMNSKEIGAELHFEPDFESDESEKVIGFVPTCRASFTILADLYYHLVQSSYYTLASRDFSFADIGEHFMQYMAWATCSWEEYSQSK